jgi:hypothetical protein
MKLNKKNKILLLTIIFSVILSVCIEEKIVMPNTLNVSNTSTDSPAVQKISNEESTNLSSPSEQLLQDGENIPEYTPEFTLESFTWIYVRDNNNKNPSSIVYDDLQNRDISERRYAVYNLSIKNNGSDTYRFNSSKLRLNSGNGSLFPETMDEMSTYPFDEIRLGDISLLPGQITTGYAAFNVDSIYNRSFLLMYNSKPVALTSFENSVLSIEKADLYDYSIAMGKPPYHVQDFGLPDTYDPPQPELYTDRGIAYSLIWSNWVNRSVVEFFKKLDLKELNNIKRDFDLPSTYSKYALKVISGKNISIHLGNPVVVTGEINEELLGDYFSEIAISDNSTFRRLNDNSAVEMNFSNATLVKIFFDNAYGWSMATRFNHNNQILVLDENRKIVFVGFHYRHFVS